MSPSDPLSAETPAARPWAVVRPPWVSFRDGMVAFDAQVIRGGLETAPPTVRRVGFSADAEGSPQEWELLDAMDHELRAGAHAVVSLRPVFEAVKVVRGGWVVGRRDRSSLATVASPVLFDRDALEGLLQETGPAGRMDPVQALVASGGRVRGFSLSP